MDAFALFHIFRYVGVNTNEAREGARLRVDINEVRILFSLLLLLFLFVFLINSGSPFRLKQAIQRQGWV